MWQGENLGHSSESFLGRLNVLRVSIYILLSIIFLRIVLLQIIKGSQYRKIADENRIVIYPQPAARGKIFDRNMDVIVDNKPSFVVLFSRQTLTDKEVDGVMEKMSRLLSIPKSVLLEKTKTETGKNFSLIRIAENISKYRAMRVSEKIPQLPGVLVRIEPVRVYKWASLASHLTGYVREASLDELSEFTNLKPGDMIGKTGIEKEYDDSLRGTNGGSQVEVNARGIQKRILETVDPIDGDSLVLTIDKKIQTLLADNLRGHVGVVIAIDPNSGGILGMASSPTYDPNLFISGMQGWQIKYLLNSDKKPLWNRALQAQYPPGSIYKMVTAFAGLEEGVITPQTVINCKGYIEVGKYKQRFRCWLREGHGDLRLVGALAQSCDVFFYETGLKLGPSKLNDWAGNFGFGKKTDIDLPSEEKGLIPDRSWKKSKLNQDWYDGDTVNMSVGQGYIWTTPIQIAQFVCALANGGTVYKPYILDKIIDQQGNAKYENVPDVKNKIDISKENYLAVKRGMIESVQYGTSKSARVPGLTIAGKTGTAQNPQGADHAWFVCFAPAEKPKIALVVMVEHGGGGGEAAAPIAQRILADIFNKRLEQTQYKPID